MADGKPTFVGKCFQFQVAVQVLMEQIHNAPSLPRCQTALELREGFVRLSVPSYKMRTDHQGERIYEQLRENLRPIQARQNRLRQVMECRVGSSINAVETLSSRHSGIIRE